MTKRGRLLSSIIILASAIAGYGAVLVARADIFYVAAEAEAGVIAGKASPQLTAESSNEGSVRFGTDNAMATLYVSTTGSDSNPGTNDSRLKTIKKAASLATPGTSILVAPGTYVGDFVTEVSGTSSARVVFRSEVKWGAKVVGATAESAWRNNGDYVDIRGFDVSGSNDIGILQSGSYGRLDGNNVHGAKVCIETYNTNYSLHDIDITGNVVHGCGSTALEHGIYASYTKGTIANNIAYGNSGFGIHCWHNCNQLTIANNLTFSNGEGGMVIGQGDSPNNGTVKADNFVVVNNICVQNGNWGIQEYGATGVNNIYSNNAVSGNAKAGIHLLTGTEKTTIAANPLFVNFQADGSGDYHLQPSSPLVNTGTSQAAPMLDIEGTTRPVAGSYDIGPYER